MVTTTRQTTTPITAIMPIIADLLGIGFFLLANSWLTMRFSRDAIDFTALQDAGLFALFHICFLFGISFVRKLHGAERFPFLNYKFVLGLFAVPYAVGFMFAIADLSSYLDTLFTVNFGDMGNAYYFLVTPAIYLFVGLLYLFILLQSAEITLDPQTWTLPTLLLINLMVAATASYLAAVFDRLTPDMARLPTAIITYALLTLLFILPRLLHYAKTRNLLTLFSFDIMLLFLAFAVGYW